MNNDRIYMRNITRAGVALMCAASMTIPSVAVAVPQTSRNISGDTLTLTTTYTSTDKLSDQDQEIEYDGASWALSSTSTATDPNYVKDKKLFEYTTDEMVLTPDQNRDLTAQFPATHAVSEDSYTGEIPLVGTTSAVIYRSVSGQVDRSYTVDGGLATNDVDTLYSLGYQTMDFETKSDAAYGATITQSLDLAYPQFFVVARDTYGIPTEYGATLNYRGAESWLEIDHYVAKATYRGEVTSSVEGMVTTSTYDKQDEPIIAPLVQPDYTPFAVAGGVAAAAVVGLVGFWVTRRVRLCEILDDGSVKVIEKIKPVSNGAGHIVEARASIDLRKPYFLNVPGKYTRKTGQLEVRVNGQTVYIGTWANHIDIRPQDEGSVI